jgi:hypothetical protein
LLAKLKGNGNELLKALEEQTIDDEEENNGE